MEFAGRIVIVTGGTGGLGGAVCKAFAAEGAEVIAAGWGAAELAARRADPEFERVRVEALDVTDDTAVNAFADSIDRCDHLVNAAGVVMRGTDAFSEELVQQCMEVNAIGTLRTSNAFLSKLEASEAGTVVNFASMLSFFGSATAPGYAASKGAVAQLTKSMAIAWAPRNVRVNAVAPGWIDTPMAAESMSNQPFHDRIVARTPMGAWGRPQHIAGPVLFLSSAAAAWVTGAILPVDGGYSIA